jgi:hypothetical protein
VPPSARARNQGSPPRQAKFSPPPPIPMRTFRACRGARHPTGGATRRRPPEAVGKHDFRANRGNARNLIQHRREPLPLRARQTSRPTASHLPRDSMNMPGLSRNVCRKLRCSRLRRVAERNRAARSIAGPKPQFNHPGRRAESAAPMVLAASAAWGLPPCGA